MSKNKKLCICAICTAMCYILPVTFHTLTLGTALSPMHLPVLLCGLVCGWPYGLACGLVGPVISSVLSGMPPAAMLVSMIPELCAYGAFSGLFYHVIHTGRPHVDLYAALIPAMLLGRVVGGIAKALVFLSDAQSYSLALWTSSYLIGTLPGAVLHLILVPVLVHLLMTARLIPMRGDNRVAANEGTVTCNAEEIAS